MNGIFREPLRQLQRVHSAPLQEERSLLQKSQHQRQANRIHIILNVVAPMIPSPSQMAALFVRRDVGQRALR